MSCDSFAAGTNCFTATIHQEKPNLVFFSIPYHEGWKAYVNGRETAIERVNVGFMAVACGEGDSQIRFEFETPMLAEGKTASLCCITAFVLYLLFYAYNTEKGEDNRLKRLVRRTRKFCRITPPQPVAAAAAEAPAPHTDSFSEDPEPEDPEPEE